MSPPWVVLELSERATGEDPEELTRCLIRTLRAPQAEVFVPATVTEVGADRRFHYLMEGYAFVRSGLPVQTYLRLDGTRYVERVLTNETGGGRPELATVPDRDIAKMRAQVRQETEQGIATDDEVFITSGSYRNLTAKVICEIPERQEVQVHIQLRSKQDIVTLPRGFLRLERRAEKAADAPYAARVRTLLVTLAHSPPFAPVRVPTLAPVRESMGRYARFQLWLDRYTLLTEQVHALKTFGTLTKALARIDVQAARVGAMRALEDRLAPARTWIVAQGGPYVHIQPVLDRFRVLSALVARLDALMPPTPKTAAPAIDNLVIDGHNLAIRVLHGLGGPDGQGLNDSQGRPTTLVYGFLKSLGGLVKRFSPGAVTVTWDAGRARRSGVYPAYKAGRPTGSHWPDTEAFHPMTYLRELLPMLGIAQAVLAGEEADDVVATLVKGPMEGKRNVIVSNDRDYLQLVTPTTLVFCPGAGKNKDKIYDLDEVVREYGVEPVKMVALRSLLGDTSDNLPGVPRVPGKLLTALLREHKTIDGIYASGLPGVTAFQYETIKTAEAAVRRNLVLMALCTDLPVDVQVAAADRALAEQRLRDVEIQPEPILDVLLPSTSNQGFLKFGT